MEGVTTIAGTSSRDKDDVGVVLGYEGGVGLAMLRLSSIAPPQGDRSVRLLARSSEGQRVEIIPFRPSWWSQEWGQEES